VLFCGSPWQRYIRHTRSTFQTFSQRWKFKMAKHHPDLIMCRKQPGVAIGRLCEKCDGKCVICDSYVRPCTLVRICDECNYGSYQGRCVICGGPGVSDAYYCKECTVQEKDRDGCPKIVNLGSSKTDLFYERKKYGFKKRWQLTGFVSYKRLCFCSVAVVCYYCTKMSGLLHLTLFCFDVVFFTSWIRAAALRRMFLTFHPVKHFCLC